MSPTKPLPQGHELQAGKYRVGAVLGQGGFGLTYQGEHVKLRQRVAIKEFLPQQFAMRQPGRPDVQAKLGHEAAFGQLVRAFVDEGRVVANVKHPNLVAVQDFFEENGTAYLIMAFAEGPNLHQVLKLRGPLPEPTVAHIVERLVKALHAVHKRGVYHLDIKPLNVLLTRRDEPVLVDFGAARVAARREMDVAIEGAQALTPGYAPPELLMKGLVGARADLFELAMMAHELLTGKAPPSAGERMKGSPWRPSGLPSPWADLLAPAVALDPEDRPEGVKVWWSRYQPVPPPEVREGVCRVRFGEDLRKVLTAVPAGTEIRLAPGDFAVGPLTIEKHVRIVGEKTGTARLLGQLAVRCDDGPVTFGNVTLDGGDETALDVKMGRVLLTDCTLNGHHSVVVREGAVDLRGCGGKAARSWAYIEGGELRVEGTIGDAGAHGFHVRGGARLRIEGVSTTRPLPLILLLRDHASTDILNCTFTGGEGEGFRLLASASLRAEKLVLTGWRCGLSLSSEAKAELSNIEFRRPSGAGVVLSDASTAALRSCSFVEVGGNAVAASGTARVEVNDTVLEANGAGGVRLSDAARAKVRGMKAAKCFGTVVQACDGASLEVKGLQVEGCAHPFLACAGTSHVTITSPVRSTVRGAGVVVQDAARFEAASLRVERSPAYGILVRDGAEARLSRCRVARCKRSGVRAEGEASVLVRGGRLERNGSNGASVDAAAHMTLVTTVLQDNVKSGVYVNGRAEAAVVDCVLRKNAYYGLEAYSSGQVALRLSTLEDNAGGDIRASKATVLVQRANRVGGAEDGSMHEKHDVSPAAAD